MKYIKVKLATILLCLGLTGLQAQEAISASGGSASGSGGTVSHSVGQVFYTTNAGINGSASQGVQQAYEIYVVKSIAEVAGIDQTTGFSLICSAFPNPTNDFLTLKIDASTSFDNAQGKPLSIQSMSYQLFDMNGKLLQSHIIEDNETKIVMSNLASATYFLKVSNGENIEIKTFKINKNK